MSAVLIVLPLSVLAGSAGAQSRMPPSNVTSRSGATEHVKTDARGLEIEGLEDQRARLVASMPSLKPPAILMALSGIIVAISLGVAMRGNDDSCDGGCHSATVPAMGVVGVLALLGGVGGGGIWLGIRAQERGVARREIDVMEREIQRLRALDVANGSGLAETTLTWLF